MVSNVKIMNVLLIILSNEKQNVVMVTVAKIQNVNLYTRAHVRKYVHYVPNAKNGIVQKFIHDPELDFALIKKIVPIWLAYVYIHQNVPNYSVQSEPIAVIFLANSIIHLNDRQYAIN